MELCDYLDPVETANTGITTRNNSIGRNIKTHTKEKGLPVLKKNGIAIIGIPFFDEIKNVNKGVADLVREKFYSLSMVSGNVNLTDLGNVKPGNSIADLYAALLEVTMTLLEKNIIPVFTGGSQKLAHAIFSAYGKTGQTINITSVDHRPGLSGATEENDPHPDYLNRIILEQNNHLFNYTNMGYQSCFTTNKELELLDELLFDYYRLGLLRSNLKEAEPVLRDTDFLVFSMSAVRESDAPANSFPSPNGLYAEEACQIAKYAGLSDRLSSMGVFDLSSTGVVNSATAHLAAQIMWYFIDGLSGRNKEYPFDKRKNCKKFIINLSHSDNELIFYKSTISERWWMEIPSSRLRKKLIAACSYEDYLQACNQEVPERWWRNYKKINF